MIEHFTMELILWKKIDYNYKLQERMRKRSWMFSENKDFWFVKSTFFVVHFWDGGRGPGKVYLLYTCKNVKIVDGWVDKMCTLMFYLLFSSGIMYSANFVTEQLIM